MKIEHDAEFRATILKAIADREFQERTGVHCSDLIYCLNKQALAKLKPLANSDEEILLFSIGWATQRWLTGKPDDEASIERDGILVTPDVVTAGHCWELKATYQSANKPIEENFHWLRQLMAQAYVTNSLTVYLSRFELMGDYKWIFGKKEEKATAKRPTLSAWKLTFDLPELEANWAWLKERKVLYEEILKSGCLILPSLALARDMEFMCNKCARKGCECEGVEEKVKIKSS